MNGSRDDAKTRRKQEKEKQLAENQGEESMEMNESGKEPALKSLRVFAPSREPKPQLDIEAVASLVVDTAMQLHRDLGPGLLESVYEAVLANMLKQRGLSVERQKPVPIDYGGVKLDEGFRLDLLVDSLLIVELKSVENIHPVHPKQLLTYLRLMKLPLGLLINFGAPLLKDGLRRVVNQHTRFASSRFRVHKNHDDKP